MVRGRSYGQRSVVSGQGSGGHRSQVSGGRGYSVVHAIRGMRSVVGGSVFGGRGSVVGGSSVGAGKGEKGGGKGEKGGRKGDRWVRHDTRKR